MARDVSDTPRRAVWFTVFAVLGVIGLAALGTWQIQRLEWKENLIAQREAGMDAAPMVAGDVTVPGDAYRRVALTGRFDHAHEFFLTGRTQRGKPGYHVVTPLITPDGTAILVDRGWIPLEARDPGTRPGGQVEGTVSFTGLVRDPAGPSLFTPDNDTEANYWFWPDLATMAAEAGLEGEAETAWYAMAGHDAPWDMPVPHEFEIDLRNDHLQYALTWYALAVALAVIAWLYRRRRA